MLFVMLLQPRDGLVGLLSRYRFIYLGFYIAFNTVQVISQRVVLLAEETSTYSWSRLCTINCRPMASNYQLSHLIYLFGVLRRLQHCTGHITTGSFTGRGNQYIQLVKVVYYKLPTNGKQLPAFPLDLFIWGFTSPSTLYRSYHDGEFYGQRKPVHTVGQGSVL